jgi:hypothetical protein
MGLSNTELTVKKDLFQDFPSQNIWKVEMNVFFPIQNISGSASVIFLVNFPPKNGSCIMNSNNGSTNSLFSISCLNWIDLDGNIDYFAYYGLSCYIFF